MYLEVTKLSNTLNLVTLYLMKLAHTKFSDSKFRYLKVVRPHEDFLHLHVWFQTAITREILQLL